MGWKGYYWIKGGLIGLVIALLYSISLREISTEAIIIYTFIGIILGIITKYSIMLFEMWKFPYWLKGAVLPIIYGLIFVFIFIVFGGGSNGSSDIFIFLIPLVLCPVGALIGWIYGKIKSGE